LYFHVVFFSAQFQEPFLELFTYGPPSSVPAEARDNSAGWILAPDNFANLINTIGLTFKFERSQVVAEVCGNRLFCLSILLCS
jgi:hypothetical protein